MDADERQRRTTTLDPHAAGAADDSPRARWQPSPWVLERRGRISFQVQTFPDSRRTRADRADAQHLLGDGVDGLLVGAVGTHLRGDVDERVLRRDLGRVRVAVPAAAAAAAGDDEPGRDERDRQEGDAAGGEGPRDWGTTGKGWLLEAGDEGTGGARMLARRRTAGPGFVRTPRCNLGCGPIRPWQRGLRGDRGLFAGEVGRMWTIGLQCGRKWVKFAARYRTGVAGLLPLRHLGPQNAERIQWPSAAHSSSRWTPRIGSRFRRSCAPPWPTASSWRKGVERNVGIWKPQDYEALIQATLDGQNPMSRAGARAAALLLLGRVRHRARRGRPSDGPQPSCSEHARPGPRGRGHRRRRLPRGLGPRGLGHLRARSDRPDHRHHREP